MGVAEEEVEERPGEEAILGGASLAVVSPPMAKPTKALAPRRLIQKSIIKWPRGPTKASRRNRMSPMAKMMPWVLPMDQMSQQPLQLREKVRRVPLLELKRLQKKKKSYAGFVRSQSGYTRSGLVTTGRATSVL